MELGLVRKIDIDREMQQSYLDYAMSVIVSRALPDARDGLKPVQRRILYAMYDMGLRADSQYKKSARIVGEVLGKYHPHGDMAVYDAMVRMAQDFSVRMLLVDGQGNFGSVDGDPPAAMRYTEARLATPALDMLEDIYKNTVDFVSNFDGTLTEPSVMPASIPNLLVNGATGIAVGMATSIPPHNLNEIVDALVYMLEHWEKLDDISVEQLMKFIQGPDFPTGGVIIQEKGEEGLESSYGSGRGKVTIQARVHLEEMERNKTRIIISELPYMTNKSNLIERIADLARNNHIEGVTDLRDESDRQGMRIVIELTKNADPEAILRELYKRTPMRSTFSIILLALVDGEPRMLSIKQALRVYIEHRLNIIRLRSEYDLEKAKHRAHVLEGLLIALKHLDEIISLIRNSPDVDTARTRLMKRYKLTDIQANAILEMQLRRLAALERKKIETEYKETQAQIKELEGLLKSPKKIRAVTAEELLKVKAAYGDRRRTQIVSLKEGKEKQSVLTASQLLPEQVVWVGFNADGVVARTNDDKPPRPSGYDAPVRLVRTSTTDTLFLVAEDGQAAAVPVHTIPEAQKLSDGQPWHRVSPLRSTEKPVAVFALPKKREFDEESYVLTVSRGGMVKKSLLSELPGPSSQAFTLVRVNEGDGLGWVMLTDGQRDVIMATAQGFAIRFKEDDVRPMGLVAAGVNGIKLGVGDEVIGAETLPAEGEVFLVTDSGSAKRVKPREFPRQGRYGRGVIAWDLRAKSKLAGMTIGKGTTQITLHLQKLAPKSTRLDDAPMRKRAAIRGSSVVDVKEGDAVTMLTSGWILERYLEPGKPAGTDGKQIKTGKKPASSKAGAKKSSTSKKSPSKKTEGSTSKKKPATRKRKTK